MRDKPKDIYHPMHVGAYGEIEDAQLAVREAQQRVILLDVLRKMDVFLNNAFMSESGWNEDLFDLRDAALSLADHLGFSAHWYEPLTYDEAMADRPRYRGKVKKIIPAELRNKIFERDNNTCQGCGTTKRLTVDHKHPESKGGTLDEDNLWTLCKSCNSSKGVKSVDEWLRPDLVNGDGEAA